MEQTGALADSPIPSSRRSQAFTNFDNATMTDQQANKLGIDATQVLENVAFKDAFSKLNAAVLDQLDACPIRDNEGRLLLTQLRKLSFMYEGILRGMVENGKLAKSRIDLNHMRNESKARGAVRKVFG
jgi:hypothetical protein